MNIVCILQVWGPTPTPPNKASPSLKRASGTWAPSSRGPYPREEGGKLLLIPQCGGKLKVLNSVNWYYLTKIINGKPRSFVQTKNYFLLQCI